MRGSGFGSDAARGVGGERWAGESSRGTAKTPPLQSALRGIAIDHHLRPQTSMGTA